MKRRVQERRVFDTLLGKHLDEGIRDRIFPGGIAIVRSGSETAVVARGRLSYTDIDASAPYVSPDTAFDIASLTKIVVTLPLALLSIQAGRMELDGRADRLLPELAAGAGSDWNCGITVRGLLAHRSGLPAWRPYFIRLREKNAYLSAIADEAPSYAPGTAVEYSDLGFMLLGWMVERAWDDGLAELADRLVFKPLGMDRTAYKPSSREAFKGCQFAPTEDGNQFERGMATAYAEGLPVIGGHSERFRLDPSDIDRLPWRKGPIRGEAHDANCHYGLSGVSGHAGLFTVAGDMARYLEFWKAGGPLLPSLRSEAFTAQTPAGAARRGLGWILEDDGAVSHTGFTGTALRLYPSSGAAAITLTNRIHPRVADGIGAWRASLMAALSVQLKNISAQGE